MDGQWEEIVWQEEKQQLMLEGEPVLEYQLRLPELRGGRGGRKINRGYDRMAQMWRRRWQRELYWAACIDLACCRGEAHPFRVWTAALDGEVTLQEKELLSLRWDVMECRGDGRPCRVQWGDVWNWKEGVPCSERQLMSGLRTSKKQALQAICTQIRQRQSAGDFFPDRDWEHALPRVIKRKDFWLTGDRIWITLPQYTIAPGVEGTPIFYLERNKG